MTSITLHLWRESAPLSPFLRVWMGLTDYRQRAKNTTDYRRKEKKLPTTDSKTINRLPTLSTFVFKKKSILYFLEVTKLNFDSSAGQTERMPVCWYKYMYIATTNIKITEVRHWKYYPFIYFIEKAKVKNRTFLVSTDVTSLCSNTPPNEGIEWVCRAYKNFCEDNRPIPKPSRNA